MPMLQEPRQEAFVQKMVEGMTQRQAYLACYPSAENWQPRSVDNAACKMFARPEVRARYRELCEQSAMKKVKTRAERMVMLSDMANDEELLPKVRMQAVDLLNKMDGAYVKKVEATISTDVSEIATEVEAILDEC